ncbi:MAG: hypothetical protein K1X48_05070 [Burkholderiaceae bacterium]|nr:hypothetical protein [Burkholderiaceae bacterium]MBX7228956.1 hypothetical protein [Burkholderiaceae bacterium]
MHIYLLAQRGFSSLGAVMLVGVYEASSYFMRKFASNLSFQRTAYSRR